MSMSIDYENPWLYNGKAFGTCDIGRLLGLFITLLIIIPNVNILEGNTFGSLELLKVRKEK